MRICWQSDSFPSDLPQVRWRNLACVSSVSRWLRQWRLGFVLLWVDPTLADGYGILKHSHSFREVKCLQGNSKTLRMGI